MASVKSLVAARPIPSRPDLAASAETLEGAARFVLFGSVVLLPMTFWRGLHEPFEFPKYLLLHFVAILLVGLQLVANAVRCRIIAIPCDDLSLGVIGLVISAGISTLNSISPTTSLTWGEHSWIGWLTFLSAAAVFFSARNLICTDDHLRRCYTALALGGIVPAGYGLIQVVGLDPFEWEAVSHFAGEKRAFGTLGHPNHLGAILAVLLPFAFAGMVGSRWKSRFLSVLFGSAILLSYSRIAWIAAVVGRIVSSDRRWSRRSLFLGVGIPLLLAAGLIATSPSFRERFTGLFRLGDRTEIATAAVKILGDYPLTGCGLNCFGSAYGPHRTPAHELVEWDTTPNQAHNEFLHLLATQGLFGGTMGVLFLGGVVSTWRRVPDAGPLKASLLAAGIVLSTGFLVVPLLTVVAVILGALASRARVETSELTTGRAVPIALAVGFVAIAAISLSHLGNDLRASHRCAEAAVLTPEQRDRAEESFTKACELQPNCAAYRSLSAQYLAADPARLREASESMRYASLLRPRDGRTLAGYARLLARVEPDRATVVYAEALKWEPNDPRLRVEVAAHFLMRNDLFTAREHLDAADRLSPDFARCTTIRALVEWQAGNKLEATRLAETAFAQNWHGDDDAIHIWYGRYGLMIFDLGRYEQAIAVGEELALHRPNLPVGPLLIAAGCEKRERFDRARESYLEVLRLDPNNGFAKAGLERLSRSSPK